MGVRFSREEALANEITAGLNQALDTAIAQLTQEDAQNAQQVEEGVESVNDLLGELDVTVSSPEEQQMFAQQPPLLLEITPPPLPTGPFPQTQTPAQPAQQFNFLGQEVEDDDDEVVAQRITERLIIARFQIPQFRLGLMRISKTIRIPAKRKTVQIGPFRKSLTLPGVSRCVGRRGLGQLCLSIPSISKTFSIGPYRKQIQLGPINQQVSTSFPNIEIADSTQIFYVDVSYPSIFGGVRNVKQLITESFNEAKDAAIQQLLFFVAFAASSGGASLAAGIQVAFTTFQNTFTASIKRRLGDLNVDIAGPGFTTESIGEFKPFFLYGR
ncbi:hypothetical protein FHS18_005231 [Paenibacillus phyllosphaerae]|uniref:Uncharacterized protein n=1 Tax=Paenibacillus phyllosphaerae TaxID=274593 RepID=A0A7W5FQB8_9BACL|nr:hypothetical protein [Paenibacillus phyllosphaerae]MBB3113128.1 hypothetical protein [Paenibacillus phyllosphaerae]